MAFIDRPRHESERAAGLIVGIAAVLLSLGASVAVGFEPLPPLQRDDCQRLYFPLPDSSPRDTERAAEFLATAIQQSDAGKTQAAFENLWRAHHADPADAHVRRMLALPAGRGETVKLQRGQHAPPQLRWRRGHYLQAETPHFVVFSTATREQTLEVAEDLERFYWVWTQVFFPLWEDRNLVAGALAGRTGLGTASHRLRIVLCKSREAYNRTLAPHVPGIEQSAGFYSDGIKATLLFAGPPEDPATRYHELTHQLLREATGAKLRGGTIPGDKEDYWLIEGVATYMESVRFAPTYGLVGGWESPRLQYARYRWLVGGDAMKLQELVAEGRSKVQRRPDLARWYSHAAAYTHLLMDGDQAGGRQAVLKRLAELYEIPLSRHELLQQETATLRAEQASEQMTSFLRLTDQRLSPLDPQIPLEELCLGQTAVTAEGLRKLPPQQKLRWLDLSHLPVDNDEVRRLVSRPGSLRQLSLEGTRIDDGLGDWLAQATALEELDLSATAASDALISQLSARLPVQTLWLTGSSVSERTLARITDWVQLQSIDVQGTNVTPQAVDRLRQARPDLNVNPLELIAAP